MGSMAKGGDALQLMTAALRILDEHGYPADIGAHLDLAVHRLREELGVRAPPHDQQHVGEAGPEDRPEA